MIELDVQGLLCPLPVIRLQALLRDLPVGDTILVVGDDRGMKADIPAFCHSHGHHLVSLDEEGTIIRACVEKKK